MAAEPNTHSGDWHRLLYTRGALHLNVAARLARERSDVNDPALSDQRRELKRHISRAAADAELLLAQIHEMASRRARDAGPRYFDRKPERHRWQGGRTSRAERRVDQTANSHRSRFLTDTLMPSAELLLAGALDMAERHGVHTVPETLIMAEHPRLKTGRWLLVERMRSAQKTSPSAQEWADSAARRSNLPYRARYNLACFRTQRGDFETASKDLAGALRQAPEGDRRRLAVQARYDYSLEPLLEDRKFGESVRATLAEFASPSTRKKQKPPDVEKE
jgi:hypothetical protein